MLGDNALMATFQVAVSEFISSGYFDGNDEETTTGALLGAIAASAPLCFEAYDQNPDFNWVRYPKSGQGSTAEPSTGADFALMLRVNETTCRFAVFQAKRTNSSGTFSVHQISPERAGTSKPPEPQFIRLTDYAKNLLTGIRNKKTKTNQLTWVHYLSYEPSSIFATPVAALTDIAEHYGKCREGAEMLYYQKFWELYPNTPQNQMERIEEQPESLAKLDPQRGTSSEKMRFARALWKDHKPLDVTSTTSGRMHFLSLLMIGASTELSEAPGWLELNETEAVKNLIGLVSKDLDIYVGRVDDNPKLDPTFGGYLNKTLEQRSKMKDGTKEEIKRSMYQDLRHFQPSDDVDPSQKPGL